jgi:hypothetical protein
MPPRRLKPDTSLGPFYSDDTLPDLVMTVTGLNDPTDFDDAVLHIDAPDGTDFSLGTSTYAISNLTASTLDVTMTADTSITWSQIGVYKANLHLMIGAQLYGVQPMIFEVKKSAITT